jgi:hypothetical protein
MFGLSILSMAIGWLSWRYVERPFRQSGPATFGSRRTVFACSGAAAAILIALGSTLDNSSIMQQRFSAASGALLSYSEFNQTDEFDAAYRIPSCYFDPTRIDLAEIDRVTCHHPVAGVANVLILGDSHGAHLWYGLATVFPDVHFLQANAAGCRPLMPAIGTEPCRALLELMWQDLMQQDGIHAVILAGRWVDEDIGRISGTIQALRNAGLVVYVAGPVPEYEAALPIILSRTGTGQDRDELASRYLDQDRFDFASAIVSESRAAGAIYLDMIDAICDARVCETMTDDMVPIQWDSDHFTPAGSVEVISRLVEHFDFADLKPDP